MDKQTAEAMAGQTAIMSLLSDLLISKGVLTQEEVTHRLHEMLPEASGEAQAPLRHPLSILEK